jgi:hypothetical protein
MTIKTAEQLKNEYGGRDPQESWDDLVDSFMNGGGGGGALFDGVTFYFVQPDPPTVTAIEVTLTLTLGGVPITYPMMDSFNIVCLTADGTAIQPWDGVYLIQNYEAMRSDGDGSQRYHMLHILTDGVWLPASTLTITASYGKTLPSSGRIAIVYRDAMYMSDVIRFDNEPA